MSIDGLRNILDQALRSVSNNCCHEDVSCTNCLRTYKNSKSHKNLVRKYARDTIHKILSKLTVTV